MLHAIIKRTADIMEKLVAGCALVGFFDKDVPLEVAALGVTVFLLLTYLFTGLAEVSK